MKTPDHLLPWFPVNWSENIPAVYALKALSEGAADEGQQKLALDYIVHVIAKRYDLPYFPDSDRDSAFAAGKLYVGEQILKLIGMKADVIQAAIDAKRTPRKR